MTNAYTCMLNINDMGGSACFVVKFSENDLKTLEVTKEILKQHKFIHKIDIRLEPEIFSSLSDVEDDLESDRAMEIEDSAIEAIGIELTEEEYELFKNNQFEDDEDSIGWYAVYDHENDILLAMCVQYTCSDELGDVEKQSNYITISK